ncbi:hypothetical protein HPB50_004926 [Hyalomma asiaticum]|uniref:Uncharacterized protein n=1 Tax=Hyalomma asiaticum TaxID=266040 RepID=A0ACB7TIS8_HYAAI|nr:hypothetical protein HPB50_004926 [Hyalomma asiaticum]
MPTCAELSKRIDELESRLLNESDRMTDRIVDKIVVKMKTSGVDVLELKKHVDSLKSSLKFLNDLVDKLHSEKASLVAENKALKSENYYLSRKVSELEQYSRMNNVEIRGISCTQGEDCVAERLAEKSMDGMTNARGKCLPLHRPTPDPCRNDDCTGCSAGSKEKSSVFLGGESVAELAFQ